MVRYASVEHRFLRKIYCARRGIALLFEECEKQKHFLSSFVRRECVERYVCVDAKYCKSSRMK